MADNNSIRDTIRMGNPHLTALAMGYKNSGYVGNLLFPTINITEFSARIPKLGRDNMQIHEARRSMFADVKRAIVTTDSYADVFLDEYSIQKEIDWQQIQINDFELNRQGLIERRTKDIADFFLLQREKQIADIAINAGNYPSGSKDTLTSTAQFTDYTHADPLTVIGDALDSIKSKIGQRGNTVIIGYDAWVELKKCDKVYLALFGANSRGVITKELVRQKLEVDTFEIAGANYDSGTGNAADAPTLVSIWGDNIVCAYIAPGMNLNANIYDSLFGFHLQYSGAGIKTPRINTFPKADTNNRILIVDGMDVMKVAMMMPTAGYLIADTNASS